MRERTRYAAYMYVTSTLHSEIASCRVFFSDQNQSRRRRRRQNSSAPSKIVQNKFNKIWHLKQCPRAESTRRSSARSRPFASRRVRTRPKELKNETQARRRKTLIITNAQTSKGRRINCARREASTLDVAEINPRNCLKLSS